MTDIFGLYFIFKMKNALTIVFCLGTILTFQPGVNCARDFAIYETTTENATTEHFHQYGDCRSDCFLEIFDDPDYELMPNGSVYLMSLNITLNPGEFYYNTTLYVCQGVLGVDYTDRFLECEHVGLEQSRFEWLDNCSVHFPRAGLTLNRSEFFYNDTLGTLFVCEGVMDLFYDDSYESRIAPALVIVTEVGTALSAACILLHLAMFCSFRAMRNLPGCILCSLCVALLAAYACVFAGRWLSRDDDCTPLGVVKIYSLQAAFFWSNAMAFDFWRSVRLATAKLRLRSAAGRRLAFYSLYAWGGPAAVLAAAFGVSAAVPDDSVYRFDIDPNFCWFRKKEALLAFFCAPVFATVGANVLLFASSLRMIRGATAAAEQRAQYAVIVRLASAMGLVWLFAVLAIWKPWMEYLSVASTVLQGVFIFLSFSFTDKMKKEMQRAVQRRKDSFYPTTTSTHQTSTTI